MKRKAQVKKDAPRKKDWRDIAETSDQRFIKKLLEKYPPPRYDPKTDGCIGPAELIQADLDHTEEHIRELADRHALEPTGTRYDVVRRRYCHWRAVKLHLGDPYIGYGPGYMSTRTPTCVPGFQTKADLEAVQQLKEKRNEESLQRRLAVKAAEEKLAIETRTQLFTASGKARRFKSGNLPPDEIERMLLETAELRKKGMWTQGRILKKLLPGVKRGSVLAAVKKLLHVGALVRLGKYIRIPKNSPSSPRSSVLGQSEGVRTADTLQTTRTTTLPRVAGRYIAGKPMAVLYTALLDGKWHKRGELGVPSGAIRRLMTDGEASKAWQVVEKNKMLKMTLSNSVEGGRTWKDAE